MGIEQHLIACLRLSKVWFMAHRPCSPAMLQPPATLRCQAWSSFGPHRTRDFDRSINHLTAHQVSDQIRTTLKVLVYCLASSGKLHLSDQSHVEMTCPWRIFVAISHRSTDC